MLAGRLLSDLGATVRAMSGRAGPWPPQPHRTIAGSVGSMTTNPVPLPSPREVWQKLTPDQRAVVRENRFDAPLPTEVVRTLAASGAILIGVSWAPDTDGFTFYLSPDWIAFLESDEAQG